MKKKFAFMLLSVLIIPIFALFGCDEANYFSVTAFSSWAEAGLVTGAGSYKEGDTVTLTATTLTAKNSSVLAWVYQNSLELSNDETYTITTDEGKQTSTLTFVMNKSTQGKYTAVFKENKLLYTKLTSWRLTTTPEEDSDSYNGQNPYSNTMLSVSQGISSTLLTNSYNTKDEGETTYNNVAVNVASEVNQVLELSPDTSRYILANTQIVKDGKNINLNLRAEIKHATSTDTVTTPNYSYKVNYSDGKYDIIFGFKIAQDSTLYLILQYQTLDKI